MAVTSTVTAPAALHDDHEHDSEHEDARGLAQLAELLGGVGLLAGRVLEQRHGRLERVAERGAVGSLSATNAITSPGWSLSITSSVGGEAVRLRLDGLGPREIAERLGISQHTIRSRLARGIAELRERFAGRRDTMELEL